MGTHPIFESDFDCLTEWTSSSLLLKARTDQKKEQFIMSALTKKKYVMAEALEEISTLEPAQSIQRVVASPGSCLFEVECANGIRSHASLPKKFRKTIYTKKGLFPFAVEQNGRGDGPGQKSKNQNFNVEDESSDDDALPENLNRVQLNYSDTSSSEEDESSDDEDDDEIPDLE